MIRTTKISIALWLFCSFLYPLEVLSDYGDGHELYQETTYYPTKAEASAAAWDAHNSGTAANAYLSQYYNTTFRSWFCGKSSINTTHATYAVSERYCGGYHYDDSYERFPARAYFVVGEPPPPDCTEQAITLTVNCSGPQDEFWQWTNAENCVGKCIFDKQANQGRSCP